MYEKSFFSSIPGKPRGSGEGRAESLSRLCFRLEPEARGEAASFIPSFILQAPREHYSVRPDEDISE